MKLATRGVVLDASAVHARAVDGTVLLDDVSFAVTAGALVAVVGPTGAGKTSLATVLAGDATVDGGTVHVHGVDVASHESARRRVALVPQDDVVHPQLAVRNTLEFAASLRLPDDFSAEARSARVDEVLALLGLEAHAEQRVGRLSGGQRKRVNVAIELVGAPDVLVLDEPTAGLDPGFERSVFASLRRLADNGTAVVAVTHSPQVLAVCDRVLFLAPGGRVAFFGTPSDAMAFFGSDDPADVFTALATEPADTWPARYRAEALEATAVEAPVAPATVEPSPVRTPSWAAQLPVLVRRTLALLRSDRRHVALLALEGPIVGLLLLAVLTPRSVVAGEEMTPQGMGIALLVSVAATWLGAAVAIREIVKDRLILRRERGVGLSAGAYVGAKALVFGGIAALQSVALVAIAMVRQAPPVEGAVLSSSRVELVVAAGLTAFAAVALALLLSALVSTVEKALALLPLVLVAQLVMAGADAWGVDAPLLRQLRDLTGARWGIEAMSGTVTGDAGRWMGAVLALVGLTVAALFVTWCLVRRSTGRPSHWVSIAPAAGLAGLVLVSALAAGGAGSFQARDASSEEGSPPVTLFEPAPEPTPTTVAVVVPPVAPPPTEPVPAPVDSTTPTTVARRAPVEVTVEEPMPTTTVAPTTTTTAPPVTTTTQPPTTTTTAPPQQQAQNDTSFWDWVFWWNMFMGG